jgi:hypothetical protein
MNSERQSGILEYAKLLMTGAALTGALLFTAAPGLKADESECQHRVAKADHHLHEAVEHHGWDSPQARHAREELRAEREHCWSRYHRWWDEDDHRWHSDQDWDAEHGHPH